MDARTRLPSLDGLRGLAIVAVLCFHLNVFSADPGMSVAGRIANGILGAGWAGVDLFFVLSGFLITGLLYDARGSRDFLEAFYARRARRILPLYYLLLTCVFVGLPALDGSLRGDPTWRHFTSGQWYYWTYLANVRSAMTGGFSQAGTGHLWSLSVEAQFYLVWPFVVRAVPRRRLTVICVVMVATAFLLRLWMPLAGVGTPYWIYVFTPTRLDGLAIGALIALLSRSPRGLASLRRWAPVAAVSAGITLAGVALLQGGLPPRALLTQALGYLAIAVLSGCLVLHAVTDSGDSRWGSLLQGRVLRHFGKHSYAIYLWHYPLLFAWRSWMPGLVPGATDAVTMACYVSAATLASTYLLARLSWLTVEAPLLSRPATRRYAPVPA